MMELRPWDNEDVYANNNRVQTPPDVVPGRQDRAFREGRFDEVETEVLGHVLRA
jgi:hypothetical protein